MSNENASIQSEFNVSAKKIISQSEWRTKLRALYRTELSFKEKVLLNTVEKPSTVIAGIASMVRRLRNFELNLEFKMAAGDGSDGYYKNVQTGETYINTGIISLEEKENMRLTLTPKLTAKTWKLGMRAAEQCRDYTSLLTAGKLKSL